MNSFYGGQSGRTYHIVKRYKSIEEMTYAFSGGGSYTEVNYGQYVLISTLNKNNDENGLLFRRGFDYDDNVSLSLKPQREDIAKNDQGQDIINPETQQLQKKYYDNVYDQNDNFIGIRFNEDKFQKDLDTYFSHVGNGAIYIGRIVGADGKTPNIGLLKWENAQGRQDSYAYLESDSDADGYEGLDNNNKPIYNNTIEAATFSILDDHNNVKEVKFALKIPKPTFIVSAQSVDAYGDTPRTHYDQASNQTDDNIEISANYDTNTGTWKYTNLIHQHTQTGKQAGHPFYHNYDIAIPKGIKGQQVTHILTETAVEAELNPEHFGPNFVPNSENGTNIDSQGNEVEIGDEYITFDVTNYDIHENGDTIQHQGRLPFRVIKTISSHIRENRLYQPMITVEENLIENPIQPQIGDLYQISNVNKVYAICIKAGGFYIEDFNNLQPGNVVKNGDTHAWWRCVQMQHPAPEYLTVEYKAGQEEEIVTGFVDYLYLDNQGNLYAKYANGEKTNLGFIDTIDKITEDDGKFTITFISTNTTDFYVNSIVDIQRIGDQIYLLYSDNDFRRNYPSTHQEYEDYRYLSYSGLNPQSRFATGEYDSDQTFIYIKLKSSIQGGYHIQGEFNYENVFWIAHRDNPFYNIKYIGELADIGEGLRILIEEDDPEDDTTSKHYDGRPEDMKALSQDEIDNIYKEGYIINIITPVSISEEETENTVDFLAYNFNHAQDNATTVFDQEKIIEYFNYSIENIIKEQTQKQQDYHNNERYILLISLLEYLNDKDENDEYRYNIYSNWYPLQQVNETSISLSRVYIIDDEDDENPDQPKNAQNNIRLNDNGIWFVTFSGHDE